MGVSFECYLLVYMKGNFCLLKMYVFFMVLTQIFMILNLSRQSNMLIIIFSDRFYSHINKCEINFQQNQVQGRWACVSTGRIVN